MVSDQISLAIAANRFTAARPGCPDVLDSLAATLVLSNGVSVQGGAALPGVVAAWQAIFGQRGLRVAVPSNARRIPWTPALTAWFAANFRPLQVRGQARAPGPGV